MSKVDTDRRLQLVHDIRQQNQYNRMKCREREQFLYGHGPVKIQSGELYGAETAVLERDQEAAAFPETGRISSFRIRLVIAIFLFCAFIAVDRSGTKINGMSASDFYERITQNMDIGELPIPWPDPVK